MAYKRDGQACVCLPELVPGDDGSAVGWVKAILAVRGYPSDETHVRFFDGTMINALMRFQKDQDIPTTGIVDAVTWAVLLMTV